MFADSMHSRFFLLGSLFVGVAMAVTSPMPYRPGYGLGSWIPHEVVQSMKEEAAARSKILLADSMLGDMRSLVAEIALASLDKDKALNTTAEVSKEDKDDWEKKLHVQQKKAWELKMNAYTDLWAQQTKQVEDLDKQTTGNASTSNGAFTTFASNIESGIDFTKSNIQYLELSFDSISADAQYFRNEEDIETADSSAHTEQITNAIKMASQSFWGYGSAASSTMAKSVAKKVTSTAEYKTIAYTLLVTAFATHRHVKRFDEAVIDPDKLLEAWNFYSEDKIPDPAIQKEAFQNGYQEITGGKSEQKSGESDDKKEYIAICTEVYLGSGLVGMVHFTEDDGTTSYQSSRVSKSSMEAQFEMDAYFEKFTGSTSFASDSAKKFADLQSTTTLQTHFSLTNLGYIPTLKDNTVTQSVKIFKEFDPASFDAGKSIGGQGTQQSNMASVIGAAIMGLDKVSTDSQVMDAKSFMNAFDDYARAAKETKGGIGMPVGLNVKTFYKEDVYKYLGEKYIPPRNLNFTKSPDDKIPETKS